MESIRRFGEYAVDMGYCAPQDVRRAVDIQRDLVSRGFPKMLIGLVMVRYGIIDNCQLLNILKVLQDQQVPALLAD
jgi:hypothetical protein